MAPSRHIGWVRDGGRWSRTGWRIRSRPTEGGVGALEAMLALGDLAEGRVELTLLSPEAEFRYRPASVAVPFGGGQVDRFALSDMAAAAGARLVTGSLERVDSTNHHAITDARE